MSIELLSPAGSIEGVRAVVQNGADAVYLGLGDFNARRNAKNLSKEEFVEAVRYCHVRGVKVYVTLNTLLTDKENISAVPYVEFIAEAGADAVLVQDFGVLEMIKQVVPDLPVHASTQMSVHNLEGVKFAASMGISRVVLARELSKQQLKFICDNSPIEIEVFMHGALCMSYSGQCYFSSVVGRRSGNRGLCAQPCRLAYGFGSKEEDRYPLSLKDLTLAGHIGELKDIGVASLKIEGRMKRPEYAAIVTRIFHTAIKENREPNAEEIQVLETAFSRQGFTDGYYMDKTGREMFGIRATKADPSAEKLFKDIRRTYTGKTELQRVPIRFWAEIKAGNPMRVAVSDSDGNTATAEGVVPEVAVNKSLFEAEVNTQLYKTGGTPYYCVSAKSKVDKDLMVPMSAINALRREAIENLTIIRGATEERKLGSFSGVSPVPNRHARPKTIVQLTKMSQLSKELVALRPDSIYLPLFGLDTSKTRQELIGDSDIKLAVVLPRVIGDHEAVEISRLLDEARKMGIDEALVGNIGHVEFVRTKDFAVRGDFGLNIFNSTSLAAVKKMGLKSAALSFELNFAQITDISKCIDTEITVYGRLPLMVTENCIMKNKFGRCVCENNITLVDRKSAIFPVVREFKHRNIIYNSQKLFLADKQEDWSNIGLWAGRLVFTTENPWECVQVLERYMGQNSYEPSSFTRGLYYRGVD